MQSIHERDMSENGWDAICVVDTGNSAATPAAVRKRVAYVTTAAQSTAACCALPLRYCYCHQLLNGMLNPLTRCKCARACVWYSTHWLVSGAVQIREGDELWLSNHLQMNRASRCRVACATVDGHQHSICAMPCVLLLCHRCAHLCPA